MSAEYISITLPPQLSYLRPYVMDDLARFGNKFDGGYLLPKTVINQIDAVLSFGVNEDWSLEEELAKSIPNLKIHAYDPTVGKRYFFKKLQKSLKRLIFKFQLKGWRDALALWRGYKSFFTGLHIHFQERVYNREDHSDDATINKIFSRLPDAKSVFLKMDIEGGEYRVIDDLLRYTDKITLLAIEFHNTDPYRDTFEKLVKKISDDFFIVHFHANNNEPMATDGLPEVVELTFLNRRYAHPTAQRIDLPLEGIDFPNNPSKPDFKICFTLCESS